MTLEATFQIFWDRYGKKRERSDAERAWQRLTGKEQQQAIDGIPAYHKRQHGATIPYPAAYLNQRLWQKPKRGNRSAAGTVRVAPASGRKDPFDEMELW
jgi:hypothetical protein